MKLSHNDDPVVIPHCFTFHHTLHLTFLFLRNIRSCNQRASNIFSFFPHGGEELLITFKSVETRIRRSEKCTILLFKSGTGKNLHKKMGGKLFGGGGFKKCRLHVDLSARLPLATTVCHCCIFTRLIAHRLASVLPAVERTQFHGHKGHRNRSQCLWISAPGKFQSFKVVDEKGTFLLKIFWDGVTCKK